MKFALSPEIAVRFGSAGGAAAADAAMAMAADTDAEITPAAKRILVDVVID